MASGASHQRRSADAPAGAHGEGAVVHLVCGNTACKRRYKISQRRAGGKLSCPRCKTALLPLASPEPAAAAEPARRSVSAKQTARQQLLARVQAGQVARNRLAVSIERLLAGSIGDAGFGYEISADIYSTNPFRYLALSADADSRELDLAVARLKTVSRLKPEAAEQTFIKTGYDGHLPRQSASAAIEQLQDPRHRIVCEFFWPHLGQAELDLICQERQIFSEPALQRLNQLAQTSGNGKAVLAKHALAVAIHNLAIAREIAYATGQSDSASGYWKQALTFWQQVLSDELFWDYLGDRAECLDDPRLRREDVALLRRRMPGLVLGFNTLFARAYADAGDSQACHRQLVLISHAGFGKDAISGALIGSLQTVTRGRLEPLIRRAEDPEAWAALQKEEDIKTPMDPSRQDAEARQWTEMAVNDGCCPGCGAKLRTPQARQCFQCGADWHGGSVTSSGTSSGPTTSSGRLARKDFARLYSPILDEALAVRRYLMSDLNISQSLLKHAEFDRLCEVVVRALNSKVDYSTDDRPRALLYSVLVQQQLLQLPVSDSQRRQLEKGIREDVDHLYKDFGGLPDGLAPGCCWFLAGEPADPDASIVQSVYKITKVRGVNVQWESRKILVPRSRLAAEMHRHRTPPAELLVQRNDEQTRQVRQRIERINAECRKKCQSLERQRDAEAEQEQARCQERLEQYNRQVATEEQRLMHAVAAVEQRVESLARAEQAKCDQASAEVRSRYAEPLREQQTVFEEKSRHWRGLPGAMQMELPGTTAGAAALLAGWGLAMGAGLVPDGMQGGIAGASAAILGAVAGLITAASFRSRLVQGLRQPLTDLERSRDEELARLHTETQRKLAQLHNRGQAKTESHRTRLAQIRDGRDQLEQDAQARITSINQRAQTQIEAIRKQASQQTAPLQQQLQERCNPKPERAKNDFPPYRTARSRGYSDGTRPSDSEIQRRVQGEVDRFLSSLTYSQKETLALLKMVLPDQQFTEMLINLASADEADRREMFSRLASVAAMGRLLR